ncbi:MAG: c-type cytochrome [Bacteroidia bacterium]|jgi:cytochrome c peroxidase|nr:c-type cytochrome [Bacteroidia bacterium]
MRKSTLILGLLGVVILAFRSWNPGPATPAHFPKPVYDFARNPLRSETVQLGRALFYDPLLSVNNGISCASCHSQYNGFAHADHALSHGIFDSIGTRNAPALMNLAWQKSFMWDGAVNHLDVQALAPITHPKEMGETLNGVIKKLNASVIYPSLFYNAFGDSAITGQRVLLALSQFQLTLISANAKYDSVKAGKAVFTPQQQRGYALFKTHCNTCHREPMFTTGAFSSNGLPVDTTLNDYGRGAITHRSADSLLFKIPTLRNIEFTYPYMHDGRFTRLSQVLNHYTSGIVPHKNLPAELQKPISLSPEEKVDLTAFLLTLTDKKFLYNPAYSYPKEIFSRGRRNPASLSSQ